jgi:hypothetical protein
MNFIDDFNHKPDCLIDHLKKFANGKTKIKFHEEIMKSALDAIAKVKAYLIFYSNNYTIILIF